MYDKILLSIDLHDEKTWQQALPRAVKLCEAFKAELHLLTVIPELPNDLLSMYVKQEPVEKMGEKVLEQMGEFVQANIDDDIETHCHIGTGTIYKVILERADDIDCDLIVMGSHRPEMSDYLLGPNAARVVRHSNRSVMVVRD